MDTVKDVTLSRFREFHGSKEVSFGSPQEREEQFGGSCFVEFCLGDLVIVVCVDRELVDDEGG